MAGVGAFWGTRVLEIVKKHDSGGLVWKRIKLTTTRKANAKKRLLRVWQVSFSFPNPPLFLLGFVFWIVNSVLHLVIENQWGFRPCNSQLYLNFEILNVERLCCEIIGPYLFRWKYDWGYANYHPLIFYMLRRRKIQLCTWAKSPKNFNFSDALLSWRNFWLDFGERCMAWA